MVSRQTSDSQETRRQIPNNQTLALADETKSISQVLAEVYIALYQNINILILNVRS